MSKFKITPGVIYGPELIKLFDFCKANNIALPAINTVGSNSINAALQAAKKANAPIIIQFSHSGAAFVSGKFLDNSDHKASILGAAIGAMHVRSLAKSYGVSVVLHTDHCPKNKLAWVDGLLELGQEYFAEHGQPLFSSHMLDLSQESLENNLEISSQYLKKFKKLNMLLELEIGLTGGEEDGLDNTQADKAQLYTNPQDALKTYQKLNNLGDFNLAIAFGNTHGVYKPGNVVLKPEILKDSQELVAQKFNLAKNPLRLVFHGGSGSEESKIKEALKYGVIKFNIDTDTQWAFTKNIKKYFDQNKAYLNSPVGNPEGDDKPNKKYFDPRAWLHQGEQGIVKRLLEAYQVLGSKGRFLISNF